MIRELENRIRERAHKIWESEGRPSDRADVHWSLARAELAADAPKKAPAQSQAPKAAAASASKVEKAEKAPQAAKAAPKATLKPKASKA